MPSSFTWLDHSDAEPRKSSTPSIASRSPTRLIFSSWRLVPRAIAGMLSYEVERRMVAGDAAVENTPEARKNRRGLLEARAEDAEPPSVDTTRLAHVLATARERIEVGLNRLGAPPTEGAVDERWYWAAPLLLDRALDANATMAWFDQADLAAAWAGASGPSKPEVQAADDGEDDGATTEATRAAADDDDGDAWEKHVEEARRLAHSGAGATLGTLDAPLGRMPDDLVEVLAELAVAGPAVAMLRALDRVVRGESALKPAERIALRNGAGRAAWSFRSLFNHPEVMSMLRGGARGLTGTPYWREVLRYCADGCLPAVLDEYVHVLRDHLGLMSGSIGDRVHEIADEICEAVELRRSRVGLDDFAVSPSGRTVKREARNLRTHFAVRFGDEKNEDGTEVTRADQVRKAFNSPFWPFVLVTATTLAMTTAAPPYAANPRWRCALTTAFASAAEAEPPGEGLRRRSHQPRRGACGSKHRAGGDLRRIGAPPRAPLPRSPHGFVSVSRRPPHLPRRPARQLAGLPAPSPRGDLCAVASTARRGSLGTKRGRHGPREVPCVTSSGSA